MAFLTKSAAAQHCNVSMSTFRRWCDAGFVPIWADPVTGTVWFTTEALDEWMAHLPERRAS
jgi:predicted site-specific integrase-resolvase